MNAVRHVFRRIPAAVAACLTAVVSVSCTPEHEYINKQVGGAEIPAGWDFSTETQWMVKQVLRDGSVLRNYVIDFSALPEFAPYCGKEVSFHAPLAIQRVDFESGTYYKLTDYKPLPDGARDLYHVPVEKGKLLAVRGLYEEICKPGEKVFKMERASVEALLEVQHPDVRVNSGKPLYLEYILADHDTPPHRIRAPWLPESAGESPHMLQLFPAVMRESQQHRDSCPNQ